MVIRKVAEGDIEKVLCMYGELYDLLRALGLPYSLSENDLKSIVPALIKSKMCCFALAEDDEGICGFVSAAIVRMDRKLNFDGEVTVGIINDIFAAERVRGSGASAKLLTHAENFFAENEVRLVESQVIMKNEASAAFFKKNGYGELARIMYKPLPRKES